MTYHTLSDCHYQWPWQLTEDTASSHIYSAAVTNLVYLIDTYVKRIEVRMQYSITMTLSLRLG